MMIVKMNEGHVPAVAELETICFSDPWSEKSVGEELGNPLSLWLVALEGETLAGYIGSQSVMGESDMMNVAVHPDHRRKGYATRMLQLDLENARNLGISRVMVTCSEGNTASEKTILKNGGVYENSVPVEDHMVKRFWIEL